MSNRPGSAGARHCGHRLDLMMRARRSLVRHLAIAHYESKTSQFRLVSNDRINEIRRPSVAGGFFSATAGSSASAFTAGLLAESAISVRMCCGAAPTFIPQSGLFALTIRVAISSTAFSSQSEVMSLRRKEPSPMPWTRSPFEGDWLGRIVTHPCL